MILGLKITQLSKDEINKLSHPKLILSTLSFGPYNPNVFKNIIPHVNNTLSINTSPYKVILIERGKSKTDSGAHRRSLVNHKVIENKLSKYFGSIFKNIILENISISEQVSLFMNAEIVIAQHGAGLCNIVWMNTINSLIIEFPPYPVNTFKNICKAKGYKYAKIQPNAKRVIEICQKRMPHIINPDSIGSIPIL